VAALAHLCDLYYLNVLSIPTALEVCAETLKLAEDHCDSALLVQG
jgi:hypothetical protein